MQIEPSKILENVMKLGLYHHTFGFEPFETIQNGHLSIQDVENA